MNRMCLIGLLTLAASAASGGEMAPFVLPWDDGTAGPTSLAAWNEKPAGAFGRIEARVDGHLYTHGERIRLFGVDMAADACWPDKVIAPGIATRLAKFGVNAVRLHHMDNAWSRPGLIRYGGGTSRALDSNVLDRVDFLVSQLIANGIYVDLNLLCSRTFMAGDGVPAPLLQMDWKEQHRVGFFDPQAMRLQQEYARQLLTHVNPYTMRTYAAEPGVSIVEINNENGLVQGYGNGALARLPDPYAGELRERWNRWLINRYRKNEVLYRAWGAREEKLGAPLFGNGDFRAGVADWVLEQHAGAKGTFEVASAADGTRHAQIRVTDTSPQGWHIQFTRGGFAVRSNALYTLRFRARAEPARTITAYAGQAHDPWRLLGFHTQLALGGDWKQFSFTFAASDEDKSARVVFSELASRQGLVEIADVDVRPGGYLGPARSISLEAANAPIVGSASDAAPTPAMEDDWVRFLAETEDSYWTGMRDLIHNELGFHGVVVGTITACSLPTIQAHMDATDSHAYWQHPEFPGRPWDPANWRIRNVSMVNEPPGTIPGIAGGKMKGKPHLCTEYDHPSPNTFSAEAPLLLAAYAAYHDLDGIFFFAYSASTNDFFGGFFDYARHPAKMVSMSVAAALFRRGDVAPGRVAADVPLSRDEEATQVARHKPGWSLPIAHYLGVPDALPLEMRMLLREGSSAGRHGYPAIPPEQNRFQTDTGEIDWDVRRPGKGVVLVRAPHTRAAVGYVDGRTFDLGDIAVAPGATRQDWCTFALTQLEGTTLRGRGRALLVLVGDVENTGMGWKDAAKSTVGTDWGRGPTRLEMVPAAITLPVPPDRVEVYALDARGQRAGRVPVADAAGSALLRLNEAPPRAPWFELVIGGVPGSAVAEPVVHPGLVSPGLFLLSTKRPEDRVEIVRAGDAAVLEIASPSGIGAAEFACRGGKWSTAMTLHLSYDKERPFKRLEGFSAALLNEAGEPAGKVETSTVKGADSVEVRMSLSAQTTPSARLRIEWVDVYR